MRVRFDFPQLLLTLWQWLFTNTVPESKVTQEKKKKKEKKKINSLDRAHVGWWHRSLRIDYRLKASTRRSLLSMCPPWTIATEWSNFWNLRPRDIPFAADPKHWRDKRIVNVVRENESYFRFALGFSLRSRVWMDCVRLWYSHFCCVSRQLWKLTSSSLCRRVALHGRWTFVVAVASFSIWWKLGGVFLCGREAVHLGRHLQAKHRAVC